MTNVEFWMFFGLIVIGIFEIMRSIDDAKHSMTWKIDELLSELKNIKSKLKRP